MQGIVFDLDETLIDRRAAVEKFAHALWSEYFQSSLEPQPQPRSQAQAQFLIDVIAKDQNGYLARPLFFAAMFQSYSKHVPSQKVIEDLFFDIVWTTPIVVEGVIDALLYFQNEGVPMGIVTNGSSMAQKSKILNSGLDKFIDVVVISESFGVKKPDPSIYLEAAARLKIKTTNSWFVGDNPMNDVWGSKQVGFQSAWITRGQPWDLEIAHCFDVKGASFSEAISKILARR